MTQQKGSRFIELVSVMSKLLAPNGCPWDQEQSIASLRPYLIEECFEVVDAIDSHDIPNHCEELGDLLFQIVFQSAVRSGEGHFDIDSVSEGISNKLKRRHPHVFNEEGKRGEEQETVDWEEIKAKEKIEKGIQSNHLLDDVPKALPALSRAQKISRKVSSVGFDWPTTQGCLHKVREECDEIEEALLEGDHDHVREEIGDLLFATVSLARKAGIDASQALSQANKKFEDRFRLVENTLLERGLTPRESNLKEMDAIWNEIKNISVK